MEFGGFLSMILLDVPVFDSERKANAVDVVTMLIISKTRRVRTFEALRTDTMILAFRSGEKSL